LATTFLQVRRDPPQPVVHVDYPDWVNSVVDWEQAYPADEERMRLAIAVARANVERATGGPFGGAIFEAASLDQSAIAEASAAFRVRLHVFLLTRQLLI
jgi:hypothetical protein